MSPAFVSALELRDSIRRRERSCAEVVRESLRTIEQRDPIINAFTATYPEHAIATAARIDNRLGQGEQSLLTGIPYALKDLTDTAGFVTTYGSPAFRDHVPSADAAVAARMSELDGVFIGKTNTPEFGGRPTTAFGLFGATRNPWDPTLSAGGSSGGSAAAVAAGMCPLAEGSDTGGSIRIPASCCGVVGLKPSRGRVSTAPRWAAAAGLFTHGPIARSVSDAALMLDAISGRVLGDPHWLEPPAGSFLAAVDENPESKRIAVITGSPPSVDPQVSAGVGATAELLAELGHHLEATGPDLGSLEDAVRVVEEAGYATIEKPPTEFIDPYAQLCHERGRRITAVEYMEATTEMHSRSSQILQFFDDWDYLLTPTVTRLPQRIEEFGAATARAAEEDLDYTRYLYAFNVTGQPAISLPLEWSREGLPIGVQLVGRLGEDRGLIALAAQLERHRPWSQREPGRPAAASVTPSPGHRPG